MSERIPAKRRTAKFTASSGNSDDPEQGDDEYRQKRKRNNEAVKKSREKTNKTASERKQRVEALKTENIQLETQIQETEKNIKMLKELLLSNNNNNSQERSRIEAILAEASDSD